MATTVTLKPNAIDLSGSTSGTTTLQASAVAGTTTVTLPAATDTLVGKATTDTLTNKTLTSPTMTAPVLGTPASGTVTNLTGTASININGTVGATTPAAGSFTTLGASGETLIGGAQTLGAGLGVKNASATSTTTGDNKIIRLAANASGADVTLSFTDAISYNSNISAKANHLLLQPVAGTVVGDFSSTGLAVTGTLSATGIVRTGSGFKSSRADGDLYIESVAATDPVYIGNEATGAYISVLNGGLDLSPLGGGNTGQIKFPATQNASANANTLDDYDEYTAASAACGGAITVAAVWKLTKVGNVVTLTLPQTIGAATAVSQFNFGTGIPAKYRPVANTVFMVQVYDNGAFLDAPGTIVVTSSGTISVYRTPTGGTNFTNGANAGLAYPVGVSWTI